MSSIALVELPALKLVDESGRNWTAFRQREPLGSKQILAAMLDDAGFDVTIINLKASNEETLFGTVQWRSHTLEKIAVGSAIESLNATDFDIWGITVNYMQEREPAASLIKHLHKQNARIVVGGSDALATPGFYLHAGADAVVQDKSGAANIAILHHILGRDDVDIHGVTLSNGVVIPPQRPPMRPQQWPLPKPWMVKSTLGQAYWEAPLPQRLKPIGAVMLDLGCDRHCDFCQTPTYRIGYGAIAAHRASDWLGAQKMAGANSVVVLSDQFLGRVLWPDGRRAVIDIMQEARELELPILWGNGLELSKATLGHGQRDSDRRPDHELIDALWGWDGARGCAQAYIPAERPLTGTSSYTKLLPWLEHKVMMKSIVRAGVPDINYGIIVGLPDDTRTSLKTLLTEVRHLRDELKSVNPSLRFRVTPYAIRPLPNTPQTASLQKQGLLRFTDPAIVGGFWTACADTHSMSYEEVCDWQLQIVNEINEPEPDWQGITGLHS